MTTSTSNAPTAETALSRAPVADATPPTPPADRGGPPRAPRPAAPARAHDAPEHTLAGRFVLVLLCLAVVLSALAFGTVHAWSIAFFQIGAGLTVLLWAADAWATRRLRVSKNFLQLPLAGLFALGLIQLLPLGAGAAAPDAVGLSVPPSRTLSLDPYATRMALVQIGALCVYFAAALAFIDTPKRLRTVVRTLVIFGTLLAVFGLLQYFLNPTQIYWFRQSPHALPFGPFINRHHFAAYMELTIGLPLGLLLAGAVKRDLLLLYIFAVVVMAIALVATASRGGVVSLGAEVLFAVAVSAVSGLLRARGPGGESGGEPGEAAGGARRFLARAGLQIALGLALLVGVLVFGGEELINRTADTITSANVTSDRTKFWEGTKEIIRAHPLVGAGLGAFGVTYTRYDQSSGAARLEQAHNDYLQLLSDAGIVGGLLGLLFVAALFAQAFARMASRDTFRRGVALGALAGCFGALVHSLFDFSLHMTANALLFLLLAALATTGARVEEEETGGRRRRRRRQRPGAGEERREGEAREASA